jgi:tetratricopeptide (TPR) repeat protein
MLFPPLLALAYNLEEEFRFSEALDVLQTAIRLSDGRDAEEELGVHLQRGRLYRNTNAFAEARESYMRAEEMASCLEDSHSELLSRIGRGILARQTGNLPESEKILRDVIAESHATHNSDAEARASQDLACTLYFAGRVAEATPLAFRAYELYESPADTARALSDTGVMLKALGHYSAAKNAFSLVLSHDLRPDVRARTEIECLEVSAITGDRVAFERWRKAIVRQYEQLPKDTQLDFEMQLGEGLALFEEFGRAEEHIQLAITIAEELGMAERMFYGEQQLSDIRKQRSKSIDQTIPLAEEAADASPVSSTIRSLENLVAVGRA